MHNRCLNLTARRGPQAGLDGPSTCGARNGRRPRDFRPTLPTREMPPVDRPSASTWTAGRLRRGGPTHCMTARFLAYADKLFTPSESFIHRSYRAFDEIEPVFIGHEMRGK